MADYLEAPVNVGGVTYDPISGQPIFDAQMSQTNQQNKPDASNPEALRQYTDAAKYSTPGTQIAPGVFTPGQVNTPAGQGVNPVDPNNPAVNVMASHNIRTVTQNRMVNPQLAEGAKVNAAMINPNSNEYITSPGDLKVGGQDAQASLANAAGASASTAAQIDKFNAAKYNASVIDQDKIPQMEVKAEQTVRGQLTQLLDFDPNAPLPLWARGAVTQATQFMAARGIDASSMAGQAITSALVNAAMPIAQQDATTYQQAAIVNTQQRAQAMLSNQAAENAAKQFNATSENQTNQFLGQLASQINMFNASQQNQIASLNAQMQQQTNIANAQMKTEVAKFNSELRDQREKFNSTNNLIIQQANVNWNRQINTANTAATNRANELNAQAILGISNTAYANLVQEGRDNLTWQFEATENAKDRGTRLIQTALDNDNQMAIQNSRSESALWSSIGEFAGNLFNNILG